jgi:hypothetical protein
MVAGSLQINQEFFLITVIMRQWILPRAESGLNGAKARTFELTIAFSFDYHLGRKTKQLPG